MSFKNTVRKKLFGHMSDDQIVKFYKIYYRLRYPSEMSRRLSFGKDNPELVFYVIRPRKDGTEGLLSLFWNVMKNLAYAEEHNYVAIVDFKNFKTQYSHDEANIWEDYFTQPSAVLLDEVYSSKNVILSGLEIEWYKREKFLPQYNVDNIRYWHDFVCKYVNLSNGMKEFVQAQEDILGLDYTKTLGLCLRGTDYVKMQPSGHPVQPSVEQALCVVDEYINKFDIKSIFLVTEDGVIYEQVKAKYGAICVTPSFDSFIYNYSGKDYLSHENSINELSNLPFERGKNYLCKIIILSRCMYMVGGNTNGMWAATLFSDVERTKRHIFDLGMYGR